MDLSNAHGRFVFLLQKPIILTNLGSWSHLELPELGGGSWTTGSTPRNHQNQHIILFSPKKIQTPFTSVAPSRETSF